MSYKATVLKVMLASPSDVSQERRLARDIVQEWNVIHAEDRGIILMPVGWETHSTPEMGERAQAIINKQILADCDLLVAVFWTRLGSPTGVAPSGTVEEIEEHLAAGKPALIYFSTAPVRLDSVDNDQYSALLSFKESCRSRGLVEDYEDLAAFRDKFARHLAQTVIRLFPHETINEEDATLHQRKAPLLNAAAQELLYEASKDSNGAIMRIGTLDGSHVQTNNREFIESDTPRSEAKWRAAVDELENAGLIEDRAGKGELFFITDSGYESADILGKPTQVELAKHTTGELDEQKLTILKLLFQKGKLEVEDIARALSVGEEMVKFHLLELKTAKMVNDQYGRTRHNPNRIVNLWSIVQEGRRYLIDNGISI